MPLTLVYFLTSTIYSLIMFNVLSYACKATEKQYGRPFVYLLLSTGISGIVVFLFCMMNARVSDMYIVFALLLFVNLFVIFGSDKGYVLFGAIHVSLHLACTRNISVCVIAMIKGLPLDDVLLDVNLRFATFLISSFLVCVVLSLFKTLISRENLYKLLEHKKQLNFVCSTGIVLFLYQAFCTKAFYYNINLLWFNFLQLLGSGLILLGYYFVFIHSLRASVWVTQTWRSALLERQLERQLAHYRAYERSEQTVRIFKHDYKKLTAGVALLLAQGQTDKALELLEQMDHVLQNNVKVHLRYSGNMLIDAVVQELENECAAIGVLFKVNPFPQAGFSLTALDCSALFSAIAEIALNECKACTLQSKHISINTISANEWLTIVTEFSCADNTIINKRISLIKRDLGYINVCQITEKHGGFTTITAKDNIAKISVHISSVQKDGANK